MSSEFCLRLQLSKYFSTVRGCKRVYHVAVFVGLRSIDGDMLHKVNVLGTQNGFLGEGQGEGFSAAINFLNPPKCPLLTIYLSHSHLIPF